MRKNYGVIQLLFVAVLVSGPLAGQDSERDPHVRNDCRLAEQVLRTGHPSPRKEWAWYAIRLCDISGPQVLADLWRNAAPAEPEQLRRLFSATREFNDRRVVDAVADAALRPGMPETTRIFAFTLLYSYAVPGIYIDARDLLNPGNLPPGTSSFSHDERTYRTRELLGDLRPEVRRILRSVIDAEQNSRVGIAAGTVLRRLENSGI